MPRIWRCGVVDYLNALPLWDALRGREGVRLIPAVPARLAELLRAGEIDLGLLPVIEYFRTPGLVLLPGVGVCARGAVASVRLFVKCPLKDVASVRLDASSRTSAALLQVLLADRYGLTPRYVSAPCDAPGIERMPEDAALLIGDPALTALRDCRFESLDLAAEWLALTGLPFVFAGWLMQHDVVPHDELAPLHKLLLSAAREGRARIGEIARAHAPRQGLEPATIETYLHENIVYDLGPQELEGLAEFGKRAARLGLCDARTVSVAM